MDYQNYRLVFDKLEEKLDIKQEEILKIVDSVKNENFKDSFIVRKLVNDLVDITRIPFPEEKVDEIVKAVLAQHQK